MVSGISGFKCKTRTDRYVLTGTEDNCNETENREDVYEMDETETLNDSYETESMEETYKIDEIYVEEPYETFGNDSFSDEIDYEYDCEDYGNEY